MEAIYNNYPCVLKLFISFSKLLRTYLGDPLDVRVNWAVVVLATSGELQSR